MLPSLKIRLITAMAQREGFEPPDSFPSTVFKTAAFDHSAISAKYYNILTKAVYNVNTFFAPFQLLTLQNIQFCMLRCKLLLNTANCVKMVMEGFLNESRVESYNHINRCGAHAVCNSIFVVDCAA